MGTNPNPSRITDELWYLWEQLHDLEPSSQLGGIYASKPGYHGMRKENDPDNYSVVDAEDQGGPSDKAAAIDWTFPEAHGGDYSRISKYSKRLRDSGKDPDDNRLDGWREFYGQADTDSGVEGYDFRYSETVSSDPSHLWHIHLSCDRDKVASKANMDKLLSVLRGEPPVSDESIAKETWDLDYVPAPRPPYNDDDYGDPDNPDEGNKTWRAKNAIRVLIEEGRERNAKLDQILAALAGGTPLPPPTAATSGTGTFTWTTDPPAQD